MKNITKNITTDTKNTIEILNAIMPTVCGFVGVTDYCNEYGEISSRRINVGGLSANRKANDIKRIENFDVTNIDIDKFNKAINRSFKGRVIKELSLDVVTLTKCKAKILEALIKPNRAQSQAQIDAYTIIGNGVKVHNTKETTYIYGQTVAGTKTISVKGVYPTDTTLTNSGVDTVLRDAIKIYLDFETIKYRLFKIDNSFIVKSKGSVLTFE